jgi:hypothetical protein
MTQIIVSNVLIFRRQIWMIDRKTVSPSEVDELLHAASFEKHLPAIELHSC